MSKRILGLAIGNRSVSGVVINSGIKGNLAEACVQASMPGPQDFGRNLSGALADLVAELDVAGTTCCVSLPTGAVSFRSIRLPFRDRKKIRQVLPYEIEPQLPFPVEDLVFDYHRVSPNRSDQSELIAAVVEKSTLAALLTVLLSFGIDPVTITAGGFATALCLADAGDQPASWLLADRDGVDLSLFLAEAGNLKLARAARLPKGDESPGTSGMRRHIYHSLLAYQDMSRPDFTPQTIYTNQPDLLQPDQQAATPVLATLPFEKTELIGRLRSGEIETGGHRLASGLDEEALALGYLEISGLKGLNFRRGPFEKKKQWVEHRKRIISSGALAMLLLLLFFTNIFVDTYYLGTQVERLDQDISAVFKTALPDVKRIVDPLQQMRIKLEATRLQLALPLATGQRTRVIDLLRAISIRIPSRTAVALTQVVIGQESILINGNTDTFNAVDDIKTRLEAADDFQKVTISSANLEKTGNRVNFKLKVQL